MSHLDCSSKNIRTDSCYSRRLEEVFPEYIEKNPVEEKSPQKEEKDCSQIQGETANREIGEVLPDLMKIKPTVQDCGLSKRKSEQIEIVSSAGNATVTKPEKTEVAELANSQKLLSTEAAQLPDR